MSATSENYRQFARRALTLAATNSPGCSDTAATFQCLRQPLKRKLVTVFGPTAVDALFERSAHLALTEFPWLADLLAEPSSPPLKGDRTAEELLDGFAAVLGYDIGLLVEFVGEDLILPLIQKAWEPVTHQVNGGGETD